MICPKCKENVSVLAKVCPVCGMELDVEGRTPDGLELTKALDAEVITIKQLVPEAAKARLGSYVWLYILIAGVILGLLAVKTGASILWILVLAAVISTVLVYRRTRKTSVSEQLAHSKISYEYGLTLVNRFFKTDMGMQKVAQSNADMVRQAEHAIAQGRRRSLVLGLGIAAAEAILLGLLIAAVPSREESEKAKAEAAQKMPDDYDGQIAWLIKAGEPEKAIDTYASSEFNDEYAGAPKRLALAQALCQAGFTAQAETFVLQHCVGKMQDLDCAKAVVKTYVAQGNKEAAAAFIARCTGLRYKSDIKKLKELI